MILLTKFSNFKDQNLIRGVYALCIQNKIGKKTESGVILDSASYMYLISELIMEGSPEPAELVFAKAMFVNAYKLVQISES